jgi:putative ATP-dependent endonuclease of OLD family
MSRIRKVEISNFRCIKSFSWVPKPGVNCIVGPGDTGKSTILDAIDLCLGARRSAQLSDRDFHNLDASVPITILLTLGNLHDDLKNIDHFGLYLRGFDPATGNIKAEPQAGYEIVLTVKLTVSDDLDPVWSLYSERAAAQQQTRVLTWSDRLKLSCTKLGAYGDHNFSWRKGSVLTKVSDEKTTVSAQLAKVGRDARKAFGDTAKDQVTETLKIVQDAAKELGIEVGEVTALLDVQSLALTGGTICLHNGDGVPLHGLGLGSTRLLITGLQRKASAQSAIVIVDELEHGLEPHRIMRLIRSLGAKEKTPPLQVFMTTHSAVAVCELSTSQLFILGKNGDAHHLRELASEMQATIRACPEALLAPSVIVCEGSSEIGLIRGIDIHRSSNLEVPNLSISALGVALADGNGENTFNRAITLQSLGYRTLVIQDNDKNAKTEQVADFEKLGGSVLKWREGRALEEELFNSLPNDAVLQLIEQAIDNAGEEIVDQNIKSASHNALDIQKCRESVAEEHTRMTLGKAAKKNSKTRKPSWYKSISRMEEVGRAIVGPNLNDADKAFKGVIDKLFQWTLNEPG